MQGFDAKFAILALACAMLLLPLSAAAEPTLHVGSKRFTESYILGEILTQAVGRTAPAEHRQGLGNTAIVLSALRSGAIDVYPEYLGTIDLEILKNPQPTSLEAMRGALRPLGLGVAVPLGFSNGYALAMRGDAGITTLSGLARRPELRLGLSHEFLGRADGWPGLAARYGLPQQPRGIDHGIAYTALAQRQDPPVRPARAGRRQALFPALRRRTAVPARPAAALAKGLERAAAPRRQYSCGRHDRDECAGGTGGQALCGDCPRLVGTQRRRYP
jgi:glycine betaine/choline ABC-type transport system substrate-binding protein